MHGEAAGCGGVRTGVKGRGGLPRSVEARGLGDGEGKTGTHREAVGQAPGPGWSCFMPLGSAHDSTDLLLV